MGCHIMDHASRCTTCPPNTCMLLSFIEHYASNNLCQMLLLEKGRKVPVFKVELCSLKNKYKLEYMHWIILFCAWLLVLALCP